MERFSPGACNTHPGAEWDLWNIVWRASGPPKMKVFAWKVITGTLATNLEKNRQQISTHAACAMCRQEDESSFHALLAYPNSTSL